MSGGPGGLSADKPKREAILDLSKYSNQHIRVKFTGGREGACINARLQRTPSLSLVSLVTGVLKGFDQLLNLVLDEVEESIQGTLNDYEIISTILTHPSPPRT